MRDAVSLRYSLRCDSHAENSDKLYSRVVARHGFIAARKYIGVSKTKNALCIIGKTNK
jgi:hypothetical protein